MKPLFIAATLLLLSATALAAKPPFEPLPLQPPIPQDNPQTQAKIALGKQLYFDPRLSITGTHSCNSCHNVAGDGADGRAVSLGVNGRQGRRNTQTIWNAAYHTVHNRDGSANTLEEQFQGHVLDPSIMGMPDAATLVQRIGQIPGYQQQFKQVFAEGVSFDNMAKAIASYERTLVTPNAAWDKYLQGDESAISAKAKRGFNQFVEVRCASCHFWVNLAGPIPGLALKQGEGFYELFPNYPDTDYETRYRLADDLGRYHFSLDETDRRMWRMPTLRNIAYTAPYFHNGAVKTLPEAVRVMAKTQLKADLSDTQVEEIVEFLKTLSGEFPPQSLPRLPGLELRSAVVE